MCSTNVQDFDEFSAQAEANRQANYRVVRDQLREWDNVSGNWYWLSFCDTEKPQGQQFLGACIVQSPSDLAPFAVAHQRRINPGGQVMTVVMSHDEIAKIPGRWRYRLMSRDEIAQMDEEIRNQ